MGFQCHTPAAPDGPERTYLTVPVTRRKPELGPLAATERQP